MDLSEIYYEDVHYIEMAEVCCVVDAEFSSSVAS
jgi:hypothetical protein